MGEINQPSGARRVETVHPPLMPGEIESRDWPAQEGARRLKLSDLFCPLSKVNPGWVARDS